MRPRDDPEALAPHDAPARARLEHIVRNDPDLMALLIHLRATDLPEWRLVAGCVYQTVWNVLTGRERGTGIRDYDVIYHDASDLSWEAEDAAIRRLAAYSPRTEVRNQARVHLWYEARFGLSYSPLKSADAALTRYPATVEAVGVRLLADDSLDIVAPFGLDDVFGMVMRRNGDPATFAAKLARVRAIWPESSVVDET
jgi:uncharacterized protein